MKRDIKGLTKEEICRRESGEAPFMGPGDLHRVFERIETDPAINAKCEVFGAGCRAVPAHRELKSRTASNAEPVLARVA